MPAAGGEKVPAQRVPVSRGAQDVASQDTLPAVSRAAELPAGTRLGVHRRREQPRLRHRPGHRVNNLLVLLWKYPLL